MINRTLVPASKTYIHNEIYNSIDRSVEEWLLDSSFVLWDSWFRYRQQMGDFLVIVCGVLSLRERIHAQTPQKIRDTVLRFQTSIRFDTRKECRTEDEKWIQMLFQHPLLFGVSAKEKVSLSRTSEFLDISITAEQVETVQRFLEEQASLFAQKTPKNQLDLLIATEAKCAPNRYQSLLLALLSQNPDVESPAFLSDIHKAQAFCSGWSFLEKEREVVTKLQGRLDRFSITSQWSYGDTRELFVLIALSSEEQQADFSWGSRHVWVFEDLLSSLQFLWTLKPQRSMLLHSSCTYPYAIECADVFLRDGMCIDEQSVLGYESEDKVFLEGDFWSAGGVLEKSQTEEEERLQQQANEELARFLLDVESDSTED